MHLFDGFRVVREGGPPLAERWPRPNSRTLVKLLAVAPGHSMHREQLMDLCWPDAGPSAAVGSLRVALHAARHALEPELRPRAASSYLLSEGTLLRLAPDTVWIDTDHAESLAERALATGDRHELSTALAAFAGEPLPEDRYETWVGPLRERIRVLRERVLLALAEAQLADGAPDDAATTARLAVAESPTEERAHRALMSAYLAQGLRRQAVRQYHRCRELLDAELGVRPGAETERLHLAALDTDAAPALAASPAPVPVLPAQLRTPAATALCGRTGELALLLAPDAPPVQLLGGEAGLGKTRLVTEAARQAVDAGSQVLWGAGHDAEGRTPFGAFVEALDAWLADRPPSERARVGGEYPELASLLPSLGRTGGGVGRSPEEERDRLFRATAGFLGDVAVRAPVLVVLDDLHAADAGSFQLLNHLARRASSGPPGALRFLVTYRPEELAETDPRRAGLDSLVRLRLARYVEVNRLTRAQCLVLAADALGLPPGTEAPERVWELSLGNPLFALEVARALGEGPPGELRAPRGVRELVAARLARLDPSARRVVEVAAVAGGDAALAEVLDVAVGGLHPRLTAPEATAGVDAAIAASVLAEREVVADGRTVSGLAFRHPLVRLTCYEQLSQARRGQLHAAYAEAVLRRRPDSVDTLAAHLTRADDPRANGYLRQAAERAAALCANDTADHYYAQLTERLDASALEAARARVDRAAVLQRMARYDDAARVLREALAELHRRGAYDGEVLAAARLAEVLAKSRSAEEGFALLDAAPPREDTAPETAAAHHAARAVLCFVTGRYQESVEAAGAAHEAALLVVGPARRRLLARSLGAQATALALAGRFAEARPVADAALPHAEAYGDPQLLGQVLSVLREHQRRSGLLREAVATGERALALAERSGDPTAASFERANLAEIHLHLADPITAADMAERAVRGAPSATEWCVPYALAALARVRMRDAARRDECDDLLERAGHIAQAQGDQQAQREVRTAGAELLIRRGSPDEAIRLLDGTQGTGCLVAWAHLMAGRAAEAITAAEAEAARAAGAGEFLARDVAHRVLRRAVTPGE
ncbi:ATP-binding protein [Streptomyces hydrogenans]|uniref:ATP-binding protein n=1 Tax=Streptomyces hydrogenans TaxID=1873719 RepID=UPI0036C48048